MNWYGVLLNDFAFPSIGVIGMVLGNWAGLAELVQKGFDENNAQIRDAGLRSGREFAKKRADIADNALQIFLNELNTEFPYSVEAGLFCFGGYGSFGLAPLSDIDSKLITDTGSIPDDTFVRMFNRFMSGDFSGNNQEPGFSDIVFGQRTFGTSLYKEFDRLAIDVVRQDGNEIVSQLLDMRLISGNPDFERKLRQHLMEISEPLEYRLKKAGYFYGIRDRFNNSTLDILGFNVKEDSLRMIHNILWMEGIIDFRNSAEIFSGRDYRVISECVDMLMSVRALLHLNKLARYGSAEKISKGNADTFEKEDVEAFYRAFENQGVRNLRDARAELYKFTQNRFKHLFGVGFQAADGIEYTTDGLKRAANSVSFDNTTLAMNLLNFSGMRSLPVASAELPDFLFCPQAYESPDRRFLDIFSGNWTYRSLMIIEKSGALENLLPGIGSTLDVYFEHGHRNEGLTRLGAGLKRLEGIDFIENLPADANAGDFIHYLRKEYGMMKQSHRTALKLALLLKSALVSNGETCGDEQYQRVKSAIPELTDNMWDIIRFVCNARKEWTEVRDYSEDTIFLRRFYPDYGDIGLRALREIRQYNVSNPKTDNPDFITISSKVGPYTEETFRKAIDNGRLEDLINIVSHATRQRHFDTVSGAILDGDADKLRALLLFAWADRQYQSDVYKQKEWNLVKKDFQDSMCMALGLEEGMYSPDNVSPLAQNIIKDFNEEFSRKLVKDYKMYLDDFAQVVSTGRPFIALNPNYSTGKAELIVASCDYRGLLWRIAGTCYKHDVVIGNTDINITRDRKDNSLNLGVDFVDVDITHLKDVQKFIDDLYHIVSTKGDVDIEETPEEIIERLGIRGKIRYVPNKKSYVITASAPAEHDPKQIGGLYGLTRYINERLLGGISLAIGQLKASRVIEFTSDLAPDEVKAISEKYFSHIDC